MSASCKDPIRVRPPAIAVPHPADLTAADGVRMAVACMTRSPHRLDTWLTYHHTVLGVELFYLRVENTPELRPLLSAAPWRDCVVAVFSNDGDTSYDYYAQMDRQNAHVNAAIELARRAGMTHLAHIDDDELIYCAAGIDAFRRVLRHGEPGVVLLRNIEAIFPHHECADYFRECTAFRCCPGAFCAYANGKSIASLRNAGLEANGPHTFRIAGGEGKKDSSAIEPHHACILHYESGTFSRWLHKYIHLAMRHKGQSHNIPFPFYKESMEAADAVRIAEADELATPSATATAIVGQKRSEALRVWKRWKTLGARSLPSPVSGRVLEVEDGAIVVLDPFHRRHDAGTATTQWQPAAMTRHSFGAC